MGNIMPDPSDDNTGAPGRFEPGAPPRRVIVSASLRGRPGSRSRFEVAIADEQARAAAAARAIADAEEMHRAKIGAPLAPAMRSPLPDGSKSGYFTQCIFSEANKRQMAHVFLAYFFRKNPIILQAVNQLKVTNNEAHSKILTSLGDTLFLLINSDPQSPTHEKYVTVNINDFVQNHRATLVEISRVFPKVSVNNFHNTPLPSLEEIEFTLRLSAKEFAADKFASTVNILLHYFVLSLDNPSVLTELPNTINLDALHNLNTLVSYMLEQVKTKFTLMPRARMPYSDYVENKEAVQAEQSAKRMRPGQ